MNHDFPQELAAALERAGQGHLLETWHDLDPREQETYVAALRNLDLGLIYSLAAQLEALPVHAADSFEPPQVFPLERSAEQVAHAERAIAVGKKLLAESKVGFVIVAGGQGSRLGFDGPKGIVPVGPVSGLSLFGWHAARLSAAQIRFGTQITWFVMTSATNDEATRAYFAAQDSFGLGADNIHFFTQEMLPALDREGRIVRSSPAELFLAPNGHGGTLQALRSTGMLERAAALGIQQFSYFQVDNPLVRPADPLFIGLHALADADMSSKVVSKDDPVEKVGVLGMADGKLGCIEYSDLPEELRGQRDTDGQLRFRAGNIAVHMIRREFVERLTVEGQLSLPWHLAHKQLKGLDFQGAEGQVEGVKFETFVFDALGLASNSVTLEVRRAEEFSPVKNAEGSDSPASCRLALTESFGRMLQAKNMALPERGADGALPLEVNPCVAEDEGQFCSAETKAEEGPHGWLYR